MIDDDINEQLRKLQAKKISKYSTAVSFSEIINQVLEKSLK